LKTLKNRANLFDEAKLLLAARVFLILMLCGLGSLKFASLFDHTHKALQPSALGVGIIAVMELALSVLLASQYWRVASTGVFVLATGFAIYTFYSSVTIGEAVDCGCFGLFRAPPWIRMATATVLLLLSILIQSNADGASTQRRA
jgi:hypothetical protein